MKQLLIVGAGASHELDFPLGSGLLDEVIKRIDENPKYLTNKEEGFFTDFLNNYFRFIGKDSNNPGFLAENRETYQRMLMPLKVELQAWRRNSSSIDAFLKAHEKNRDYGNFGKFAIAFFIIGKEEWLMRENLYAFKNNWLRSFVERHFESHLVKILAGNNELQIVTFNYDRNIEHFLYNYVRHQSIIPVSGWDEKSGKDKAKDVVNSLKIIHVYNSLAELEWQNRSGKIIRFGERNNDNGSVMLASGNIQLIQEGGIGRLDSVKRDEIQEVVKNSGRIYFLGFGFDTENMEVLFGMGVNGKGFKTPAECFATGYGLNKKTMSQYDFIKFYEHSKCYDLVEDLSVFKI